MKLYALKAVYQFGRNLYDATPNVMDAEPYEVRTKVWLALDDIREMTAAYHKYDCEIEWMPNFKGD